MTKQSNNLAKKIMKKFFNGVLTCIMRGDILLVRQQQRGIKIMGGIVFIAGLGVVMTMLMSLK